MSDWTVGTEKGMLFVISDEEEYFHGIAVNFLPSVMSVEITDTNSWTIMDIPKEAFTEFVRQLNDIVFPDGINSSS